MDFGQSSIDNKLGPEKRPDLTERQQSILELIIRGHTTQEIADRLSYAPGTIKNDLTSAFKKLGAKNRPEAAYKYILFYGT